MPGNKGNTDSRFIVRNSRARTEDSGVNPETQHYTQPKGQRITSNVNMPHTPIQRQEGKDGTVAHSTQVNFRTKLSGIKTTFQNGKSQ